MKLKIKNGHQPACSYCAYGQNSPIEGEVLCVKRGIMDTESCCKKFLYDPFKRRPKKTPALPRFEESDFVLL